MLQKHFLQTPSDRSLRSHLREGALKKNSEFPKRSVCTRLLCTSQSAPSTVTNQLTSEISSMLFKSSVHVVARCRVVAHNRDAVKSTEPQLAGDNSIRGDTGFPHQLEVNTLHKKPAPPHRWHQARCAEGLVIFERISLTTTQNGGLRTRVIRQRRLNCDLTEACGRGREELTPWFFPRIADKLSADVISAQRAREKNALARRQSTTRLC